MSTFLIYILAAIAFGGGAYAHYRCIRFHHERPLIALLAIDFVALVLAVTAFTAPERFHAWMQEDGWAEWATFLAFATACGLFIAEGRRHWGRYWMSRASRVLLALGFGTTALFCAFVAGEEISWGQRLFAIQPPEVFLHANYQQELNVHNLLKGKELGGFELESKYLVALVAIVYGLIYPAAVARLRPGQLPDAFRKVAAPLVLAPAFALVALAELVYPVSLTGEAAELILGLAFAMAALLHRPAPARRHPVAQATPAWVAGGILATSLVMQPVVAGVLYGSDDGAIASTRADLDALAEALPAALTDRIDRKRSVHKRLYTSIQQGYVDFGNPSPLAVSAEPVRARYFLDAWNNPYWMRWSREQQALVVYSFGPNPRRDTDFKAGLAADNPAPRGDDIASAIYLRPRQGSRAQARTYPPRRERRPPAR